MSWATWVELGVKVLTSLRLWRRQKPPPKPIVLPLRPVLLVEDEPSDAKLALRVLAKEGIPCEWIESGEHALMLMTKVSYRLAIIDIGLRGMDGYTLAKTIRAEYDEFPIIFFTGTPDNLFCIEPGFPCMLLIKSIDQYALVRAVNMCKS